MSLYESQTSSIKYESMPGFANRPRWLAIALAIATLYSFICVVMFASDDYKSKQRHGEHIASMQKINEPFRKLDGALFSKLNAIVEKSDADFKSHQNRMVITYGVLIALIVASGIYFVKPVSAIGLFVASIWTASFLSLIALVFDPNMEIASYLMIVRTYGWGEFGRWLHMSEAAIQVVAMMALYFYASLSQKR